MLTESLAWYSALQVVERTLGREHLRRLLSMMREVYATPRTRAEVPLLRATDSFLTYRKGPFAMYALRESRHREVNGALGACRRYRYGRLLYPRRSISPGTQVAFRVAPQFLSISSKPHVLGSCDAESRQQPRQHLAGPREGQQGGGGHAGVETRFRWMPNRSRGVRSRTQEGPENRYTCNAPHAPGEMHHRWGGKPAREGSTAEPLIDVEGRTIQGDQTSRGSKR